MKIFSKEQIYEGDSLTAQKQNITSTELMERAATRIFDWMHLRMQGAQVPIHVFCGIGNNGGDGLVLARHLITHGYNVHVYIINYSDTRSKDFLLNYDRIKNVTKKWPLLMTNAKELPVINPDDIIVDAIFGIGLNRPIDDWVKVLFQHLRASKAFTLSIDIPSGLFTDKLHANDNEVIWANYTLSFQTPKLLFFLPETAKFTTQWEVLDIGIDPEYLYNTQTTYELVGKMEMLPLYRPREKFSNKGTYGHALIIGGSFGKIGSITLASRSALSAGAGLVTSYVPKCGYQILQTSFPEAMVITDKEEEIISNIQFDIEPSVIAFGVGVGTAHKTIDAFESFLKTNKTPLVIDADGLNILSKKKSLLKLLPKQTILTPHPKELERLIGTWKDDFDKLEKTKALSKKHDLIIVIKGANTITIYQDKGYVNTTGNPGLATAGTGDVLTGVITGLAAQGYEPIVATLFGIYLHGKAADIAVEDLGYQSLIASHVIEALGEAYIDLFKQPEAPQVEEEETEKK
ncbi:bifunctional ADP-dependent NAD(P)H-hydrate dehydratase/NAD(P)H-hydrate epimerase [Oceanihabitans sediminis]|uniref:bifunctional ADP-dependent NAD(P)H-hydrate dehydratase/NAD(P)H-hydrate epimerase n=1 Tax=Oceanihabitans sediminis TaxID=1812012 RepID=UPI00093060F8|nr:bifunctional ADP-dependent NAD(P)H-hydrate dehydratase/NAD(P)H-hydrate epimerase [Oceanihabitans sediminis]MDX1278213.1 bifunctional ADP-dependent NAD(P)H-hydrate dehydratase/NAD(P)H-hydrate epimerase [Oceanihabitans sediminis]MDX1773718.1 bifunctional ADP-dependent NAD(P)H-hydrate dehydratase/NAD(P)H-hydrate epimerase [Oceanihabitans sediminis]